MPTGWDGSPVVDAAIAEGAKGVWIFFEPYEGAHIYVERTDGGSTAIWIAQIWTSFDNGTSVPDDPIVEFAIDPAKTKHDFGFEGPFKYIAIGNKSVVGDVVVFTSSVMLNGGLE